jgi:Na+-translocating ferredoxin:NAD+ oxidoreductase subunit G
MSTLVEKRAHWRTLMPYQSGLLTLVGILTAAALSLGHQATQAPIAASLRKDMQASLSQVLPAGSFDNALLTSTLTRPASDGPRTVYVAQKAGAVTGLVFQVSGKGYAGAIRIVMGISPDGQVLGVRVISHTETPGLGDKIEAQRSNWIEAFVGKTLDSAKWAVKKDGGEFDQFAGATITPRAVVRAVHEGLQWYAANRAKILKEAAK